jgi:hypothetical protein
VLIAQLTGRELEDVMEPMHNGATAFITPPCITFLTTVFWTDGLATVHQHPPRYYPGHHQVFVLLYQTTLYGAKSRDMCLHTTITTTMSWRQLWQRHHCNYTINTLAQITQDLAEIKSVFGTRQGTRWHSWLRHCATSWKVVGSIPNGVIGIFIDIILSSTLWHWDRLTL